MLLTEFLAARLSMSADRRLLLSDCCCSTRTIRRSSRQKLFPTNFRRSPFAEHCWLYNLLLTARYLFAVRCLYRWSLLAVWFLLLAAWLLFLVPCHLSHAARYTLLAAVQLNFPYSKPTAHLSLLDVRPCRPLIVVLSSQIVDRCSLRATRLPLLTAPPLVAAGSFLSIDWTE